jgi:hypothetical protein
MDMAERPIIETMPLQVGYAARSVDIVAGRTGKAGVHDADIDCTFPGSRIFGEKALGRL